MGKPGPDPNVTPGDTLQVFAERDRPGDPMTASEVADRLGCSRRTALRKLEALAERSEVETKKVGARSRVWWRPNATETDGGHVAEHRSTRQLAEFVRAVEDYAIFMLDPEGRVSSWNEGAARIKGYEAEEILGEHISAFYTEEDVAEGIPDRNLRVAREEGQCEDSGRRVRADGTTFYADVDITSIWDDDGSLRGYTKVTRDMTEQRRVRNERELNLAVSRSVGRAASLDDGLREVLEDVCEFTDWTVGRAWLSAEGDDIGRLAASHVESTERGTVDPGAVDVAEWGQTGIPRRVVEAGEPVWYPDGAEDGTPFVVEAGLRAGLGVPVLVDGDVAAVLEFYMAERRERDERLVDIVSAVAVELGALVERKRVGDGAERERQLAEQLYEATPSIVAVVEPSGDFDRMNSAFRELYRLEAPVEDLSVDDTDLYDERGEYLPPAERPAGRVFDSGEPVDGQLCQHREADGGHRWLSVNAVPLRDEEGAVERVVIAAEDITSLKESQEGLKRRRAELESELNEIFGRISEAFFAIDDDWTLTYVNDQARPVLASAMGLDPGLGEDLTGMEFREEIPEAGGTVFFERYARALHTQEPQHFEAYFAPLDTWFEVSAYPSETGISVYFRDVTDRVERDAELRRYEKIFETVQDGVYTVNGEGRFTMVNEAYAEMTGRSREELLGSHVSEVVDVETIETVRNIEEELASGDAKSAKMEADVLTADGGTIRAEATFALLPQTDEDYQRVGVVRDVSERVERERALAESERRYRALAENFPGGAVALFDDDLHLELVAGGFFDEVELSPDEIEGRRLSELDELGLGEEYEAYFRDTLAGEQTSYEVDVGRFVFEVHNVPVEDDEGEVVYGLSMALDVTDRKERERVLRRYQTVFETVEDGIYILDPNLRFDEVNEALVEMTGHSEEELVGAHYTTIFDEEVAASTADLLQAMDGAGETSVTLQADVVTASGERLPSEKRFSRLPGEEDPRVSVGVVRDLSARREYQRELRRYETLIDESTDVNAIVDEEGVIDYVTPSSSYVLGYGPDELEGVPATEFIHTDDRAAVEMALSNLADGTEGRPTTEFRFRHANGSWVWLESRGRNLMDDPTIGGLVVYTREITDRKEYERELEQRNRQQEAVSMLGRIALGSPDVDELFDEAVRWVSEVLGTEYSEVLDLDTESGRLHLRQGVGWRDGLVGSASVEASADSRAGFTLEAQEPIVVEDLTTEERFSGPELLTSHDVTSGISTIIGPPESPWGILGAHDTERRTFDARDVSFLQTVANILSEYIRRQAYQEELEELVERLEESNERLERFAHIASHDLQEPLRMVSSYLQLVEERYADDLDEDGEEFIEYAVDGAERMREMINGLLSYSRVQSRGAPLEPTDTEAVVDAVLQNLEVQIAENDTTVDVGSLPLVLADRNQLEQLLQNLFSNAVKYRSDEPPEIDVGAETGDGWATFHVADNGIGMEPEHTDRVFDVFERLHTQEEYAGTGIGLALCKKIVERHDGDIWAESTPGEGTTFYFTLRLADGERGVNVDAGDTERGGPS